MITLTPHLPADIKATDAEIAEMQRTDLDQLIERLERDVYRRAADAKGYVTVRNARAQNGDEYVDFSMQITGSFSRAGDRYVFGNGFALNWDALIATMRESYARFT